MASAESTKPKVSRRRPPALSATPALSKGRGTGSRDSATATSEMTTASTPIGTLTQKIDDQGNTLSSRPPTTLPAATARPLTAAQIPIGRARASGGYASEISDRVSDDMTAPPIPCTTRKPISIPPDVERAQPADASVKTMTPATNTRLRPIWSPSAPPRGISAARARA